MPKVRARVNYYKPININYWLLVTEDSESDAEEPLKPVEKVAKKNLSNDKEFSSLEDLSRSNAQGNAKMF